MKESIKRCKFSELLWEDYVMDYPKEFLNEDLKKETKQNKLPSGKSDLTFRDSKGRLVLVELQLNALDRKHMAQTIEYRMDYIDKGEKNIRTVLLCNEIKESRKAYVDKWDKTIPDLNLETIVISIKKVKETIQKIDPKVQWIDDDKKKNETSSIETRNIPIKDIKVLEEAIKKKKDQLFIRKLLNEYKAKNFTLSPMEFDTSMDFFSSDRKLKYPVHPKEILFDIKKEISEVHFSSELTHHRNHFYQYQSLIEDCLNYEMGFKEYKKLLFMPNLVNVPSKDRVQDQKKPKIDLILFTDTYFGRRTFRLLWQPSNWKYEAFYDKEKYKKIEENYKNKMNDYLGKKTKEKNKDHNPYIDFSEEKTEINRERNHSLNQIREWHATECDFLIHTDLANSYTSYGSRKDYFIIFDIKEAFPSLWLENIRNAKRAGGLGNFWGRFGLCLSGLVNLVYEDLSINFDVNIKGKIKYLTDFMTEEDIILHNAQYYSELIDLSLYKEDVGWTSRGVIGNDKLGKLEIVTGFEIEDANHKIGAIYNDEIGMRAAMESI